MMDETEKSRVIHLLRLRGIGAAWSSGLTGIDEEVFFLREYDASRMDIAQLTRDLMDVLPHRTIWVTRLAPDAPAVRLF